MRAGRIEEADALAERIGTDITKQNSTRLRIFVFMNCIISRLALRAQNNACNFFQEINTPDEWRSTVGTDAKPFLVYDNNGPAAASQN